MQAFEPESFAFCQSSQRVAMPNITPHTMSPTEVRSTGVSSEHDTSSGRKIHWTFVLELQVHEAGKVSDFIQTGLA
jgi:hypothetical protein